MFKSGSRPAAQDADPAPSRSRLVDADAADPAPSRSRLVTLPQFEVRDACVYQVDGLCSVHAVRPFGCRVFFCDPSSTDWQNELYEKSLERVRAIHERHGLPYRYMEWRAGLVEAGAAAAPPRSLNG